jgi:plasmid stabilization system protein ParE
MSKFSVVLNSEAERDILDAYEWGVRNWGNQPAEKWVRGLYDAIFDRLKKFPKSCSIARESADADREIRQLVLGRYRVLFEIRSNEVIVLHVRGSYSHSSEGDEE